MQKTNVICVVGPTASGKSSIAIELAKELNGEIISGDSMQIYKGMPIASAVTTIEERQGIKHYLTECIDCSNNYSVASFMKMAKDAVDEITAKGKVPIIVGGTGFFIDSFIKNIKFVESEIDYEYRESLKEKTNEELFDMLSQSDPKAAEEIHMNNRKRVIRALELYHSGTSKTQQNEESLKEESPYNALYVGLNSEDRNYLYSRIDMRVDQMVDQGLVDEAKSFRQYSDTTAGQAIGHKEFYKYFDGEITLDEAIESVKIETRHYAKRQLTWFRRNEDINWYFIDKQSMEEIVADVIDKYKQFQTKGE